MADNTIKINVEVDDRPVKSLKAELRETMQQLQQTELGTEAFDKLNQKAAALKDRMAEVNEQVAVFATGSKYEQVSNSLGEIGAGLRDMDFDRVTNGAKLFAQTSKSITFKDAIGSLKQMGSAFVSIGKTILTNPLFLIVAVVGAIIAAVIALLDELGILKVIFKAVGDAIGWVIQQLKDFLDWIGLTDYAAEESAAKQAEAQEKIAQSHADKRAKVTDAYDHEIRLAQIAGENTVEMERQKQYAIIETSREEIAALRLKMEAMKAAGTLTKEKADEIRAAITELKTGIREASQEIQVINATEVADNKAANEKKAADNKAASDKRKADREQEKADRLAASRMIQDAELDLMKEGIEKERKEQNLKYERLIQDTLANKKLEQDEKDKLEIALKEQQHNALKAIDQKYLDETNEALRIADETKKLNAEEAAKKLNEDKKAAAEESLKISQDFAAAEIAAREEMQAAMLGIAQGTVELLGAVGGKSKALQMTALAIEKGAAIANVVINAAKEMSANAAAAALNPLNAITGGAAGAAQLLKSNIFTKIRAGLAIATIAATGLNSAKTIASGGGASGGGASGGGGGGSTSAQTPSIGGMQQGPQTPQMNLNNSQAQTAQSNSKRDKVMVVDYHDIQNKGNELQMMNNKVTLA